MLSVMATIYAKRGPTPRGGSVLPDDLKHYRAPRATDAFQILTGEEVAVVLGILFALLLVADVVFR